MTDQDNNLLFDCSSFCLANGSDWLPNLNLLMEPNMLDNLKRVQIERSIQTVVRIMVIKVNKRRILKTRITETFLQLRFSLSRKQIFFDSPLNRREKCIFDQHKHKQMMKNCRSKSFKAQLRCRKDETLYKSSSLFLNKCVLIGI